MKILIESEGQWYNTRVLDAMTGEELQGVKEVHVHIAVPSEEHPEGIAEVILKMDGVQVESYDMNCQAEEVANH